MEIFLGLVALLAALLFYFLPGIVAEHRGRDGAGIIAVLNLLFGWTVIGWLVLLVIAFTGQSGTEREQREEELKLLRQMAAKAGEQ